MSRKIIIMTYSVIKCERTKLFIKTKVPHWVLNGMSPSIPPPSGLNYLSGKGGRKSARARGGGCLQGDSAFQTKQDWRTYELKETVTACTELHRFKTDEASAMKVGSRNGVPPLTKKLFSREKSVFSKGTSMIHGTTLLDRTRTQE